MNTTNVQILVSKFHFPPKEQASLKKVTESWSDAGNEQEEPGICQVWEQGRDHGLLRLGQKDSGANLRRLQLTKDNTN